MLTISNYHYIRPNFNAKYPSIFGVSPQAFKKQLLLLKEKGDFIKPRDFINNYDTVLKSKGNYILITFDDGLKEQFDYGLSILNELELLAVFFVNSNTIEEHKISTVHKIHLLRSILAPQIIFEALNKITALKLSIADKNKAYKMYRYDDKNSATLKYVLNYKLSIDQQEIMIENLFKKHFDKNEVIETLYMNKKQIIHLAENGSLGSHTHNHLPLGLLNSENMNYELEHSKLYFETLTQTKVEMVAYPYGTRDACTQEVAIKAKEIGYKFGFTTHRALNYSDENYLLLNRFDCNDLIGGKKPIFNL